MDCGRPMPNNHPTFEIGLVMAGAVSAGAYTAGALDFLIEALDVWHDLKQKEAGLPDAQKTAPTHAVRLNVISGASAGAMCGAILASSLPYGFPHVRKDGDPGNPGNPLFSAWVEGIDIAPLLDERDCRDGQLRSLLNCTRLDEILGRVLAFSGPKLEREYVANPLPVRLAVANLCGVPYRFATKGNTDAGHAMRVHKDFMDFSVHGAGTGNGPPVMPGSIRADHPNSASHPAWQSLGEAALASGAFPFFLKARRLERQHGDYQERTFIDPGCGSAEPAQAIKVPPSWRDASDPYAFVCVDGGIMDNEPIELAREALAGGPLACNPRKGSEAKRAVLLIDPFVEDAREAEGLTQWPVHRLILPMLEAWKMQCRFKSVDLALANHEDVYSRFMLAPSRGDDQPGAHPLAAGALGGFLGFFHRQYRLHDYLLGRRNCQWFLKKHFALPISNPLFAQWPAHLKQDKRFLIDGNTKPHLPIVPVVDACDPEEVTPKWPQGVFDPTSLEEQISRRLDVVYEGLKKDLGLGWGTKLMLNLAWFFKKGGLVEASISTVRGALLRQKLD